MRVLALECANCCVDASSEARSAEDTVTINGLDVVPAAHQVLQAPRTVQRMA